MNAKHILVAPVTDLFDERYNLQFTVHQKHNFSKAYEVKCKAFPLQARRGPEGSRKLRFPDFVTTA